MPSPSLSLVIILVLSCALLGGYASMGLAYRHGFLDAIGDCIRIAHGSAPPSTECVLVRAHEYHRTGYTGIKHVDGYFAVLLEFFALGLASGAGPGERDVEGLLASTYMATLFCGAWFLMAMEGLRKRNAGRLLSYTGSFGLVFQMVTVTIIAPIYHALHLLGLPQIQDFDTVAVDPLDLRLLPWSTVISYLLPTLGLALTQLNVLSPNATYLAIALWQPFPLYQSIVHPLLHAVCGGSTTSSPRKAQHSPEQMERSLGKAYRFILTLCMGVHLVVVGSLIANHLHPDLIPNLSAARTLAPTSLTHPPTLAMANTPVPALASRAIVTGFLRWDIYCASTSFVLWAGYLAYHAERGPGFVGVLEKILFWAVVGGPMAPAAILLWERDAAVMRRARDSQVSNKRK